MLCVLPGTLAEDEIKPVVKQVEDIIAEYGGVNVTVEDRGKSRLAHPIKHIRYGYFQLIQFEAGPEAIAQINAKTRLITQLLRALITIFNPEARAEKNKRLKEMAAQFVSTNAPKSEQKESRSASSVQAKKEVKAEVKPKAKKETSSDDATGAPTEEKMEKIGEKLDKVLDSALKDV